MNIVLVSGNLTGDPEVRYTDANKAITTFSVAINEGKTKEGTEKEPTYVDIKCFDRTAENAAEYLRRGRRVLIEGRLVTEKWTDRETGAPRKWQRVYATRVEFLSPPQGVVATDGFPPLGETAPKPMTPEQEQELDRLPF